MTGGEVCVWIRAGSAAIRRSRMPRLWSFLAATLAALVGCEPRNRPTATVAPTSAKPASLKLLVVDDSALARRIGRYRGEWKARSGADLVVAEATSAELDAMGSLAADAIVYPSASLGTLCEKRSIRPIKSAWLERHELHQDELFEPAGLADLKWGDELFAVPLGSPVFVCLYRRDLLEQVHRKPPRTWAEYQDLARLLGDRKNLPGADLPDDWAGAIEPLAPGWAGRILLARAAAYAKHRDYYATLWDRETMTPQIASPPFIRALDELVATVNFKSGPTGGKSPRSLNASPAEACRGIIDGHCALAMTWPSAVESVPADGDAVKSVSEKTKLLDIGLCELPGSPEAYNPREKSWQRRPAEDDSRVSLLAIAGRLGSVAAGTKSPVVAFQLLEWLSGDEWGSRISPASAATAPYRRGQLPRGDRWMNQELSGASKEYGQSLEAAFLRSQWLMPPRIPGYAEYMSALDDAVRRAALGETPSAIALERAAARWQEITKRVGLSAQRDAYQRSLGFEK